MDFKDLGRPSQDGIPDLLKMMFITPSLAAIFFWEGDVFPVVGMADKNGKEAGAAFLAENKDKPGVITLPSGLQVLVALGSVRCARACRANL